MTDQSEAFKAATCTGKERFATYELAAMVLGRRTRRDNRRSAYRCRHCKGFHLGTPNRKLSR